MNGQKKICFLMPVHYMASRGGGAEIQAKYLIDALNSKTNYDIYFICRRAPKNQEKNQRIWKIGSETGLGRFGTFVDSIKIYNTLKEVSPQILYQNVGCAYTGIAAYYAKRNRAKLIWHIASDMDVDDRLIVGFKNRLQTIIDRLFLLYGIKNANIIAAQTEYQNMLLKNKFGRECQAYIPIGHPLPGKIRKRDDKVTILWVASLKPLKQPEIFIKMAKSLSSMQNVEFVMMGHSTTGKWFSGLLRDLKSVPTLKYLGLVSQDDVNKYLSKAHILVNTSRFEGFSNTFIQAWLREVPVVSLNVDPDNILVRRSIGFHSRTFEQMCHDIRSLISDASLRVSMGQRAKQYALEHHTVDKMADSLISLFDTV